MSLLNLVQGQRVYTQQIQNDLSTSNVMINCDPRLKGPEGSVLDVKSRAGKVGVEDDICDLTVSNLSANRIITEDIFLNGASLANEIFQGFLTTPLQVNIDANNKNITNVANFGAGRVDTSQIFGAAGPGTGGSGGLMAIRPNGISTSTAGQLAQNLQIGNAELPGDVIIETGGISGNNSIGQLSLRCTQQDIPGQYNINIGTDMGVAPAATPKTQIISIGTDNTTGANLVNNILIGNTASSNLQFFSTTNVIDISTSGGTKPSTLAAAGLDQNTINTTAAANPTAAIANITDILQQYGLINP